MVDVPEDHVHVATGAANRVVQAYGFATFLPSGFLPALIQAVLQALLQHQAGQQVVSEPEPKGRKTKTGED